MDKQYIGANIDLRPKEERDKIFFHEEIATGSGQYSVYGAQEDVFPNLVNKYPKENQRATSSCMAHAGALALGIDNEGEGEGFVRLSPALPYRLRSNYPQEGMILDNLFEIARKIGTCKRELLPIPEVEAEANALVIPNGILEQSKEYAISNHVNVLNNNDLDVLNGIASQGKAMVLIIYATKREWAQLYPKRLDNVNLISAPIRHGVTLLPKSGFKDANGKRFIMVQDSVPEWGSIHCLDEDWVANRVYGAGYALNLVNQPSTVVKPNYYFKIPMKVGDSSLDVKWLQACLQYLGFFPTTDASGKPFAPTGYFGGMTLKAAKDFQRTYKEEILTPVGLEAPTGYIGPSSIVKLNSLFWGKN